MAVDSVTSTSPAIAERESDVKSIKLSSTGGGGSNDLEHQSQILHNSHSATAAALVAAAAAAGNGSGSQHSIDAILGIRAAERSRQQQLASGGGLGGPISSGHLQLLHSLHNHHHHHHHPHHYLNFSQFAAMNNNNNHETSSKGESGNKRIFGSLSDEGAMSSEEGHSGSNHHHNDLSRGESTNTGPSGTMNLTNYNYLSPTSRGAGSDTSEESRRGIKRAIKELNSSDLSAGNAQRSSFFS
jgi:hypothetical protein